VGHRVGESVEGALPLRWVGNGLQGPGVLDGAALPVDEVLRDLLRLAVPPDIAVAGHGNVREDGVPLANGVHGVAVAAVVGAGRHAKEAALGVDGTQAALAVHADPGNVVADAGHLPLVGKLLWDLDHGQICLYVWPTCTRAHYPRTHSPTTRQTLPHADGKAPQM